MSSDDGEKCREKITEELPTTEYETSGGRKIIRISFNTLPNVYNNVYVVFLDDKVFLVDFGISVKPASFFEKFQKDVTEKYSVRIEDIYGIIITHAHIDHFGGIPRLRKINPNLKVYVHELDLKGVEKVEEMLAYANHYYVLFLRRAGLDEQSIQDYMNLYMAMRISLRPERVTRALKDMDDLEGFKAIHTPGHSPGHVCLLLDDIIFTGDHVLPHITPHQFPESIMKYTGTGHYMESLKKLQDFLKGKRVSLGLPGHYTLIEDVVARAEEIKRHHYRRLNEITKMCEEPKTIAQLARALFPDKDGYQFILAVNEVGAHVEYLWDRGYLSIKNVSEISKDERIPLLWSTSRYFTENF